MATFFSKFNLKTGLNTQRNKFDLSCQNLTTMDFYNIKPVYVRECIPNETISIDVSSFTRLSPMHNPMLGQCRIVTRAFFVPYRTAWRSWNAFITDTKAASRGLISRPSSVPFVTNSTLYQVFHNNTRFATTEGATLDKFDFIDEYGEYYIFTKYGKTFYDILLNLGYSINFTELDTTKYSALPILSLTRLVYDWLSNSQYENADTLLNYFDIQDTSLGLTPAFFTAVSPFLIVLYKNDYFTSAFDKPNGPNTSTSNVDLIANEIDPAFVTSNRASVRSNEFNGSPIAAVNNTTEYNNLTIFTQSTIDALKALTDYIKRMQFSGTRAIDRYFAKFGIKLESAKLDRSDYIGKIETNIQVSDVMQTATDGTTGTGLGDYAGKGIGYGNGKFKYSTEEFGLIIILSYIEPRTSCVQGIDRSILHIDKTDFFTPEFDSLSYQAISQNELVCDCKSGVDYSSYCNNHNYSPDGVFGFTSRYSEYKYGRDRLTGDFRRFMFRNDMNTWHLYRMFDNAISQYNSNPDESFKHSYDFSIPNSSEYNRIFADSGEVTQADHFFVLFNFDVTVYSPMHPMFEAYHFGEHGKDVTMPVGGTSLRD